MHLSMCWSPSSWLIIFHVGLKSKYSDIFEIIFLISTEHADGHLLERWRLNSGLYAKGSGIEIVCFHRVNHTIHNKDEILMLCIKRMCLVTLNIRIFQLHTLCNVFHANPNARWLLWESAALLVTHPRRWWYARQYILYASCGGSGIAEWNSSATIAKMMAFLYEKAFHINTPLWRNSNAELWIFYFLPALPNCWTNKWSAGDLERLGDHVTLV